MPSAWTDRTPQQGSSSQVRKGTFAFLPQQPPYPSETARLAPEHPHSWQGYDFDLTDVTFDGGDFGGAVFSGGTVSFGAATFSGGAAHFMGATFSGGAAQFMSAMFSGGTVSFAGAVFSGGAVGFAGATFSGSTVDFIGAGGEAPAGLPTTGEPRAGLLLPPAWSN